MICAEAQARTHAHTQTGVGGREARAETTAMQQPDGSENRKEQVRTVKIASRSV